MYPISVKGVAVVRSQVVTKGSKPLSATTHNQCLNTHIAKDIIGPLPRSHSRNKYNIVVYDYATS